MGLFGSAGGDQTIKVSRPDYITNMTNDLQSQVQNLRTPTWQNQQYAGLTSDQEAALNDLASSGQLRQYADQLMGAGEEGVGQLNDLQNQLQNAYGQQITSDQVDRLSSQLYNRQQVQDAVDAANSATEQQLATGTNPEAAQQTMQQSGFGSSARLAKDQASRAALAQEQQNSSDITNQAYNSAVEQAQGILSGNRQNQLSALSGLTQNAATQAGMLNQGANAYNQSYTNALTAGQQRYSNAQGALDTDYNNAIGAQNMSDMDIQNRVNAASVMNGVLGQKTTVQNTGGGSGILGGAMAGAAAGSSMGPYGALAGAIIGGVASA